MKGEPSCERVAAFASRGPGYRQRQVDVLTSVNPAVSISEHRCKFSAHVCGTRASFHSARIGHQEFFEKGSEVRFVI
jgi:hypothetical protein